MLNMKKLILNMLVAIKKVTQVKTFDRSKFTYTTGYTYYSASGDGAPTALRCGRIVQITGAYKATSDRPSATKYTIGKVPSGCEPQLTCSFVQQGSGVNRFRLSIDTNGYMYIERYGTTSNVQIPNNAWINITCVYICKDY